MKTSFRILSLLSCAALLSIAPVAHADTVTGYFWNNVIPACNASKVCTGNQGAIPSPLPSTASATNTFTISNPIGSSLFNFFSATDGGVNALSSFLSTGQGGLSNGDVVSTTGSAVTDINDGLFLFNGTTNFTLGETVNFLNDDGIELFLDGSSTPTINAGGPIANGTESFVVGAGLVGTHTFQLYYAETNTAPARLVTNILPTPEPNSLMLLGTGVLGAAGMLRRRLLA